MEQFKNRSFLKLLDYTPEEINVLLKLSAELKAKKDEIFGREEFEVLSENEAFAELKNDMDNLTVEEIESRAKQIFADHVIANGQFALNKGEVENKTKKIGFNFTIIIQNSTDFLLNQSNVSGTFFLKKMPPFYTKMSVKWGTSVSGKN